MALTQIQLAWRPSIKRWLILILALIAAMVLVGGATRLTDSGLSITEWKPIMGAIPPLNEAAWLAAFEKYKQIPEYIQINRGMSLGDFKSIFWWEWGHRFLGRIIGLVFFVPFVVFLFAKALEASLLKRFALAFVLGGAQGAMGWYMVKSGLVDRVDVSQYRLAAHLGLALLIFGFLHWVYLGMTQYTYSSLKRSNERWQKGTYTAFLLLIIVFVQMLAGAFVAGLDAGQAYNSWPLMDGALIPNGLDIMKPWWRNLFENALTVQFDHRMMAYGLLIVSLFQWVRLRKQTGENIGGHRSASFLLLAICGQILLGIVTLLAKVPLSLGVLHQAGALVVLICVIYHLHCLVRIA